jgi:hypothetical protein
MCKKASLLDACIAKFDIDLVANLEIKRILYKDIKSDVYAYKINVIIYTRNNKKYIIKDHNNIILICSMLRRAIIFVLLLYYSCILIRKQWLNITITLCKRYIPYQN